jgi:hypothetical protein
MYDAGPTAAAFATRIQLTLRQVSAAGCGAQTSATTSAAPSRHYHTFIEQHIKRGMPFPRDSAAVARNWQTRVELRHGLGAHMKRCPLTLGRLRSRPFSLSRTRPRVLQNAGVVAATATAAAAAAESFTATVVRRPGTRSALSNRLLPMTYYYARRLLATLRP